MRRKIRADQIDRIRLILSALDQASDLHRGVLGVHHLAAAELGLAQPQHGRAELLDHGVITVDLLLELPVDVTLQLPRF